METPGGAAKASAEDKTANPIVRHMPAIPKQDLKTQ
jgi:hypothetical protein